MTQLDRGCRRPVSEVAGLKILLRVTVGGADSVELSVGSGDGDAVALGAAQLTSLAS